MASIKQNPSGTWRVQVDCKGARRSKTLPTREAAEAWAKPIEARLQAKHEFDVAAAHTMLATLVPKRVLSAMAAVPHSLREVLEAAVPARSFVGVYFLILDGEVVYVGQSVDILTRVSRHRRAGRQFDSYAYLTCGKDQLDDMEAAYISALMPWLNHSLGRRQTAEPKPCPT